MMDHFFIFGMILSNTFFLIPISSTIISPQYFFQDTNNDIFLLKKVIVFEALKASPRTADVSPLMPDGISTEKTSNLD